MALRHTAGFWPVVFALVGNIAVTAIKFFAAIISGSSSMFSEAAHSLADTLNQMLLLIGLRRSLKKANTTFAYGYGRERFFWALISACGIFFVGAGITAYKGVMSFIEPHPIEFTPIIFVVLFLSFAIEYYTFLNAERNLRRSFPAVDWAERMRLADPATLAVYLEDAVAVIGVLIAAASITISYYSGKTAWDAGGSIVISILLGMVALTLIVKNRSFLLGRAMPRELQEDIIDFLTSDAAIEKVIDFKSSMIGFGAYRIKCEVEFNGSAIFDEAYQQSSLRDQYEEVKNDYEAFKRFTVDYADRIPRLMGKKIDEIEGALRKRFPAVRHIDIEIN
jgi:zinc transporter 9